MREITIDERDFDSPQQLMGWVRETLALPEWWGGSLPAFHDALTDICEPTLITVIRRDPTPDTWFDKATLVIVRSAMENECLKARVK